jgi:hypothetical protein
MDNRARKIHAQPDPANAGTKHLGPDFDPRLAATLFQKIEIQKMVVVGKENVHAPIAALRDVMRALLGFATVSRPSSYRQLLGHRRVLPDILRREMTIFMHSQNCRGRPRSGIVMLLACVIWVMLASLADSMTETDQIFPAIVPSNDEVVLAPDPKVSSTDFVNSFDDDGGTFHAQQALQCAAFRLKPGSHHHATARVLPGFYGDRIHIASFLPEVRLPERWPKPNRFRS